jgi:hypothetical protein
MKLILDNRSGGSTIKVSPPIPVRIEWADSQGRVTASWLAAHFNFCGKYPYWFTVRGESPHDVDFRANLVRGGTHQRDWVQRTGTG